MNTPAIARWTPTGWESWFQPTEDAYKAVEYIASTCRAEKVKLNNRAERVWVEEVDEAAYAAWREKTPAAKPVVAHHAFTNAVEASKHLGYASSNHVACQLVGSKRSQFVRLGCGVSVCYEKNIPD